MSPRNKTQNEHIRAERRGEILQAAIKLFALSGFSQTTMSDVAEAAGVSHGTVFLYFPTKEDLFRAALVEPLAEFRSLLLDTGGEGTPLERIRRLAARQMNLVHRQEGYLRLTQYVIGLRERFPELATELFNFGHEATDALMPLIREGQACGELAQCDPFAVAWAWFAYVQGIGLVIIDITDDGWQGLIESGIRLFGPLPGKQEG